MNSDDLGRQLFDASQVEEVRRLLEEGAPVNWQTKWGRTPLTTACYHNRAAVVRVLLEYKPDINQQDDDGDTAAHIICRWGPIECLQLLIATGQCDLGIFNKAGRTPLGDAVYYGNLDIVEYFITEYSVDVNAQVTKNGDAVIGLAAQGGQLSIVKYFVTECKVDVNNNESLTGHVLKLAVSAGDVDFLRVLASKHNLDVFVSEVILLAVEGWQLDIIKYLITEYGVDVDNPINKLGDTLLGLAVKQGKLEIVKHLVTEYNAKPDGIMNKTGRTPLGEAIWGEQLNIIKFLITECSVDVNAPVTKNGETMTTLAAQRGTLDILKYLITDSRVDVSNLKELMRGILKLNVVTSDVDLLRVLVSKHSLDINVSEVMSMAVEGWKLEIIKFLVTECSVDVNNPIQNKLGDTPLRLAVKQGSLTIVDYLITECSAKPDCSSLFLALKQYISTSNFKIFHYLLTNYHCDPNAKNKNGQTPLALAPDNETIQLLLQHGAVAPDVYTEHRKTLGKIFSKDPLKSPVKMFVIGHSNEGKSTLIKAMEHEPSIFAPLVSTFVKPKKVKGVDQRTAGIIPRTFKSQFYGDVQFYDFAGREAYYSSHAAVIKSAVNTSSPIFIFVVGLHREDTTIAQSVSYWLGIITDQCSNMEGRAPLIVVASHADLVTDQAEVDRKKQIILLAVKRFPILNMVKIFPLDCRFSNSDGMKTLRCSLGTSCYSVQAKLAVSLNSHMMLIYLLDNYPNEVAIKLEELKQKIEHDTTSQDISEKYKQKLAFIPTTIPHLTEICTQLSDKGHILFLPDALSPLKSFIIIDKTKLLGKVNGTIFAPKDFKQHCKIATSTGVVPQSKLAAHFPELEVDILIGFLSNLELAIPIEDKKVFSLIDQHLTSTGESQIIDKENGFVFCPALIQLEVPDEVFECQHDCGYRFGWVLSCLSDDDFFNARFLHVCILRLSLMFDHDPESSVVANPAIQRRCSVWTTGVCWLTPQGAKVLVDIIAKKYVLVLIQAHGEISQSLLDMRNTVLSKIETAASEFCPTIKSRVLLLPLSDVTYPIDISQSENIFSLNSVAQSIVKQDSFVVSTTGTKSAKVIDCLQPEVYADLGENILQPLFNQNDSAHNTKISDRFLSTLSSSWSRNPQLVDIICSAIAKETKTTPESFEDLESALKLWRDATNASYKNLPQLLNPLSVFAGKSPLELAGVSPKTFSEELLPHFQPTVTQPGRALGDGLTIKDLQRRTGVSDTQLDSEIIDHDLQSLASCFDNIDAYVYQLGLSAGQQTDIKEHIFHYGNQSAMREALRLWRKPNPYTATFRALINITLELRDGVVADKLCKYIADKVPAVH